MDRYSLPLYEGVDWNNPLRAVYPTFCYVSLFTREWIEILLLSKLRKSGCSLPLYEGVDWNFIWISSSLCLGFVSLFTREWIEIGLQTGLGLDLCRLPLYEGVDWNLCLAVRCNSVASSPSLRGSGLKSCYLDNGDYAEYVSLFTREWIEMVVCVSGLPK